MRKLVPTLLAVLLLVATSVATAATATTLNQRSTQTALSAYATYLNGLIGHAAKGESGDAAFIKTVKTNCSGALSGIASIKESKMTKSEKAAITDIGEEIGGDIAVTFTEASASGFHALNTRLNRLHWTGKGTATTVKRFVSAESAVLSLQTSAICEDGWAISSNPYTEPAPTKKFLTRYLGDSRRLTTDLKTFTALLASHTTKADASLAAKVTKLTTQLKKLTSNDESRSQSSLTAVLLKS